MTRNITIIDLWTDENRGDAALQLSLIRLLRARYPGSRITGLYRYGFNEFPRLGKELGLSCGELDEALGGPRVTHLGGAGAWWQRMAPLRVVANLLALARFVATMVAFAVLGRFSRLLMTSCEWRAYVAIRDADLVVWKGKNFREYGDRRTFTRALSLTINVLPALLLGKRPLCVNASFWSIRQPLARIYYRWVMRKCVAIVVREAESMLNARELAPDHPALSQAPDLSFYLVGTFARTVQSPPASERAATAAFTITEWGTPAQRSAYIEAMTAAMIALADAGIVKVVVVPQVIRARESNAGAAGAIVERARAARPALDVEVMEADLTVEDLMRFYATCRLLVATRMHSCVFARAVGTPFIAVAYDEGAKWGILRSFWPERLVIPLSAVGPASLSSEIPSLLADSRALIVDSQPGFDALIADVERNLPDVPA